MAIRYLTLGFDFLQGSDAIWHAIMQGLHPRGDIPSQLTLSSSPGAASEGFPDTIIMQRNVRLVQVYWMRVH